MIELDLRTLLPLVREAFDDRTLQLFKPDQDFCRYSGPCAVGLGIPPEERERLDIDGSVSSLVELGKVSIPDDQLDDFRDLQAAHDECVWTRHRYAVPSPEHFERTLTRLEAKYATAR